MSQLGAIDRVKAPVGAHHSYGSRLCSQVPRDRLVQQPERVGGDIWGAQCDERRFS